MFAEVNAAHRGLFGLFYQKELALKTGVLTVLALGVLGGLGAYMAFTPVGSPSFYLAVGLGGATLVMALLAEGVLVLKCFANQAERSPEDFASFYEYFLYAAEHDVEGGAKKLVNRKKSLFNLVMGSEKLQTLKMFTLQTAPLQWAILREMFKRDYSPEYESIQFVIHAKLADIYTKNFEYFPFDFVEENLPLYLSLATITLDTQNFFFKILPEVVETLDEAGYQELWQWLGKRDKDPTLSYVVGGEGCEFDDTTTISGRVLVYLPK